MINNRRNFADVAIIGSGLHLAIATAGISKSNFSTNRDWNKNKRSLDEIMREDVERSYTFPIHHLEDFDFPSDLKYIRPDTSPNRVIGSNKEQGEGFRTPLTSKEKNELKKHRRRAKLARKRNR